MFASSKDAVAASAVRVLILSAAFRCAVHENDGFVATQASLEAMGVLYQLAITFRSAQDNSENLSPNLGNPGLIYSDVSQKDIDDMKAKKGPPKNGGNDISLRGACSKLVHFETSDSTFYINGSEHHLLLSGKNGKKKWIIDLEVRLFAMWLIQAFE